jgi:hypothetical protein
MRFGMDMAMTQQATALKTADQRKQKDADGRVKPDHDDPHGGLRIFLSKSAPRRAVARIRKTRFTQQNQC